MIAPIPRVLAALCLLFVCQMACSETRENTGVCDGRGCPKECVALKGPDCDVREPACRERIFQAVQCVRGTPGTLPEIRVRTEEELRREANLEEHPDAGVSLTRLKDGPGAASDAATAVLDAGGPADAGLAEAGDPDAAPVAEPDAGQAPAAEAGVDVKEHWNIALELLGLSVTMPATDKIDDLAGRYDSLTQQITLVDRGKPQDSPGAQMTLAHELVHALQDQQYGLLELWHGRVGTTDEQLATGCLIEGEAKLYEELSWGLLQGLPVDRAYWDVLFDRYEKYNRDAVAEADAPWNSLWLLRYGLGGRYLADAWLAGGNAAVARVLESPPITTVHWMHGYAEAQTRSVPLLQSLRCNDAEAPADFERVSSDTLGAFTLFAFLAHNLPASGVYPTEASWRRALDWRQDRFELYAGPDGETALSWRLRFADASVATGVAEDLRLLAALKLRVEQQDEEVQIVARAKTELLEAWPATDPEHCPKSMW